MPTYFSINDGNFSSGLATVVGDVSAAGTNGFLLTTTYTFPTTAATSPGATYTGVAFQLSAVSGTPTGTIDLILSGNNGSTTTGSFPVSGLAQFTSSSNIAPNYPVGWQYFSFDTPITFANGTAIRVGAKTSVSNKVSLMGASLANLNRSYVTTGMGNPISASDVVHIVGTLSANGLVQRTVNYDVATNILGNLYIHNGGVLNFDPSMDIDLTLSGASGMQITPSGTVNVGTSSNAVQASKIHNIKVSSSFIGVHNGATFNAYGAYKTPYALLNTNAAVSAVVYDLSTDISNWTSNGSVSSLGDSLIICPNISSFSSSETTFARQNTSTSLTAWRNSTFAHNSSNYIPSIVNMTRNVRLSGGNFYIRFLDGSNSNLNNVEFNGLRNATFKGLQFCTNSTGSVSLSNCAFNGTRVASTPAFSFDATKTPTWNVNIKGCNFSGYGATTDIISLNAVSANNFVFTNNVVLSASQNGMFINALSSTSAEIKNNFLIGNTQNGLRVVNPFLISGSIGGIGCMNGNCGSVVAGTNNRANYDGLAGHYNTKEGVNISGTIPQLSSTIFSNITANNNTTVGLEISGNSNNLLSPITVNINGVVSNNNSDAGFEGYAITGNLSSMTLNNNVGYGLKTSIGNGVTIFNGISSEGTSSGGITLTKVGTTLSAASPFGVGTDSSIRFNGTSDFLRVTETSSLVFGTNNFTAECWVYITSSAVQQTIMGQWGGVTGSNVLSWVINTSNDANRFLRFMVSGTGSTVLFDQVTTTALPLSTWSHVALTKDTGGVYKIFLNGVLCGNGTVTDDTELYDATNDISIGATSNGASYFNGFMSNIRIVNGTALYTSDFNTSAPISPLTPLFVVENTAFLYKHPYDTSYKNTDTAACAFGILSSYNYFPAIIRNSKLTTNTSDYKNSAILLDSSNFEQFSVESSTLSGQEDINVASSRNLVEGSYQFNNCTFGSGILSSTVENYQPEVFTENGFVVMKENGVSNKHYRLLRAGKISLDTTLAKSPNTVSEKLEPYSTTTKLRCGSKMVPVNKNKSYTVSCYVYKSNGYSGDAPRLVLKRNVALGYDDTVLDTSVGANETWELLTGTLPAALDAGIFEVYVDCSGEAGCGSVNIDSWNLV